MSGTDGIRQDGRGRRRRAAPRLPDPLLPLKLEAARELGLLEKAVRVGWGNLSAAEAGRIGGYMTRLRNEARGRPGAIDLNEARGRPGAIDLNEARGRPGGGELKEAQRAE
jgi:hypothetical protein